MENQRLTLTVPEVAEMIGVSRAHAYELIRLGRIPAIRLGRRLIVPRKALEEFLDTASRSGSAESQRAPEAGGR